MFLTNQDVVELVTWRRALHAMPELSGEEAVTAAAVQRFMAATGPDEVVSGLGGHGVAVVYRGAAPGPTVLLRAELDALPIQELASHDHRSTTPGKGHLCGHDGHMASLAAVGRGLGRQRPARGRVVLLFQPAEETGAGAAAVIADPRFVGLRPDLAFSWHNLPGLPRGAVALAEGPVNCASRGMRITLTGRTAHASQPENGRSPMQAMAGLMPALAALAPGGALGPGYAMITVTHARLGERAFGVAPGEAEIWATLRTMVDADMDRLRLAAEALAQQAAEAAGLALTVSYEDVFDHCENAPAAVALLRRALDAEGIAHGPGDLPMRGSEDFGRFGQTTPAAMFFLGAGVDHASLHNPDYDFPDDLIAIGARVMLRTVRDVLG